MIEGVVSLLIAQNYTTHWSVCDMVKRVSNLPGDVGFANRSCA